MWKVEKWAAEFAGSFWVNQTSAPMRSTKWKKIKRSHLMLIENQRSTSDLHLPSDVRGCLTLPVSLNVTFLALSKFNLPPQLQHRNR